MALIKLTTIKTFQYRGADEEWSNSYILSGTQPADNAAWTTLATAVKNAEILCLPANVQVTEWYGYNEGSWETKPTSHDYHGTLLSSIAGTLSETGGIRLPGDAAVWVRWDTGQLNSEGKKVYLRKYFHGAMATAAAPDTVLPAQKTALNAFAAKFEDGTTFGGSLRICRPSGALTIGHAAADYVTTRTLKRRGKRPPTP